MNFITTAAWLISFTALSIFPASVEQIFEQASAAYYATDYEKAIDLYQQALKIKSLPAIHFNLGMAYKKLNKPEQAINSFAHAIALNPQHVQAHVHLADLYHSKKILEKAIQHYERVVTLDAQSLQAHRALGQIYFEQEKLEQSLTHILAARALNPSDVHLTFEAANTLNIANRLESALALYMELLAKVPNHYSILYNVAYTLKKMGRMDEALEFYAQTLAQKPDYIDGQFGLGLAYLSLGDFERGWQGYEWRLKKTDKSIHRAFSEPMLDVNAVAGKTVFLHAEQGLGDTLQFIRYARQLKNKGARVIAAVQRPLVRLLSLAPYLDRVIALQDPLPAFDMQAPLVSLPYLFKTTIPTIPEKTTYLYADKDLLAQWHETLSKDTNFKVGICWQGNPNYSTQFLRMTVAAKSVPASFFAPIAQVAGVSVYSLQRESGTTQLGSNKDTHNFKLFNEQFDVTHGRFMDTAAVMQNMDLIITVDTSTAHLAGALGVPVWVLIPNPPDWRWMLDRDDSPWYPTMRLFRQPTIGDWQSVLKTIIQELEKVVKEREQI